MEVKLGRGYHSQTKAQRNGVLKCFKLKKTLKRLLRPPPAFMQNPSKPTGSPLFFKSLCGMGTGRDLRGLEVQCPACCRVKGTAVPREGRCGSGRPVIARSGVSPQEAAAGHVSASKQILEPGGKAQVGNGKWGSGPFIWIPVSKCSRI